MKFWKIKRQESDILAKYISCKQVTNSASSQGLPNSISNEEINIENFMKNVFFSKLYSIINKEYEYEVFSPPEEKEECLNMFLSEIQKKHLAFGEKYISYEELILKGYLDEVKKICNEEITNFKKDINEILSQTSSNVTDDLINYITRKINTIEYIKQVMYINIIDTINNKCIKQLTKEQCEEIRHQVEEQFDERIIMKDLVYILIERIKTNSKKKLLNISVPVSHKNDIRKINIMIKGYYDFLKSLPITLSMTNSTSIFGSSKYTKEYDDLVDIAFKDLVLYFSNGYDPSLIHNPIEDSYGISSITFTGE